MEGDKVASPNRGISRWKGQVPGVRWQEIGGPEKPVPDTWHLLGFVSVGGVFPRLLASVEDAVDHRHIG